MSNLRTAAQQALEAICTCGPEQRDAANALRAALAEPTGKEGLQVEPGQEPGCHVFNVTVNGRLHEWEPTTFAFALRDGKHALYTTPPQRKPWVGLTEAERTDIIDEEITENQNSEHWALAQSIEAKLKEKNAR